MTQEKNQNQTQTKNQIKEPGRYQVIFMNDDYTPMDFVIQVLVDIFYHSRDVADELTKLIHDKGKAVVGTYVHEIAEQKSIETTTMARSNGHPLQVTVEKE
jgi:ATP-dependent Clp protease adaptor protein ClpS